MLIDKRSWSAAQSKGESGSEEDSGSEEPYSEEAFISLNAISQATLV